MIRKLLLGIMIASLSFCSLLSINSIAPVVVSAAELGNDAETCSLYRWYYKVENGKKYMRLWDGTYYRWITDWILVEE